MGVETGVAETEVCPSNFIFAARRRFFCYLSSTRRKNEIGTTDLWARDLLMGS
jgi:hypothetical protein